MCSSNVCRKSVQYAEWARSRALRGGLRTDASHSSRARRRYFEFYNMHRTAPCRALGGMLAGSAP